MALKLLSKQEIQQGKVRERQREVAEGVKLAKRVDGLREMAAKEEAGLFAFRDKTIAEVHAQIKQETEKRDALIREVRKLEKETAEALVPLNEALKRLDATEIRLNDLSKSLSERETSVKAREKAVEEAELRASSLNVKADFNYQHLQKSLTEAYGLEARLKAELSGAVSDREKQAKEHENAMREVEKRTSLLDGLEGNLAAREEHLVKEIAEHNKNVIRFNDRLAKEERNLKRKK